MRATARESNGKDKSGGEPEKERRTNHVRSGSGLGCVQAPPRCCHSCDLRRSSLGLFATLFVEVRSKGDAKLGPHSSLDIRTPAPYVFFFPEASPDLAAPLFVSH
eukprot:1238804-Pyramimonas_sp.AAC.1